jgi:hypothetical protein
MADFTYLALDTAGRERRGSVRATTPVEAREKLGQRRLFVVKIEEGAGASGEAPPLLSRQLFVRRKLGAKQLTVFTRQLSTLVQVSPLEEVAAHHRPADGEGAGAQHPARCACRRAGRAATVRSDGAAAGELSRPVSRHGVGR